MLTHIISGFTDEMEKIAGVKASLPWAVSRGLTGAGSTLAIGLTMNKVMKDLKKKQKEAKSKTEQAKAVAPLAAVGGGIGLVKGFSEKGIEDYEEIIEVKVMSNRLNWQAITEVANIAKYNIYRSIVGVESANDGPFALTDGMTLEVQIDEGTTQTFTFVSADFTNIGAASPEEISNIFNNNGSGLFAHPGVSDSVYVRSNNILGSARIIGGSADTVLGFPSVIYSEKSHFIKIAEVTHAEGILEYIDVDGKVYDWYHITAVTNLGDESAPTIDKQAGPAREPVCNVFGKIQDGNGVALPDQVVEATIDYPPSIDGEEYIGVSRETKSTLSLRDGTFEIELLQRASYRINIKSIEFSRIVTIPESTSANLFTLDFEEKDLDSGGKILIIRRIY